MFLPPRASRERLSAVVPGHERTHMSSPACQSLLSSPPPASNPPLSSYNRIWSRLNIREISIPRSNLKILTWLWRFPKDDSNEILVGKIWGFCDEQLRTEFHKMNVTFFKIRHFVLKSAFPFTFKFFVKENVGLVKRTWMEYCPWRLEVYKGQEVQCWIGVLHKRISESS